MFFFLFEKTRCEVRRYSIFPFRIWKDTVTKNKEKQRYSIFPFLFLFHLFKPPPCWSLQSCTDFIISTFCLGIASTRKTQAGEVEAGWVLLHMPGVDLRVDFSLKLFLQIFAASARVDFEFAGPSSNSLNILREPHHCAEWIDSKYMKIVSSKALAKNVP